MVSVGHSETLVWILRVLELVGLLAFFSSFFFRKEGTPLASLNPRYWKPIWRPEVRQLFRPPGYSLMVGGLQVFAVALILLWVLSGSPC